MRKNTKTNKGEIIFLIVLNALMLMCVAGVIFAPEVLKPIFMLGVIFFVCVTILSTLVSSWIAMKKLNN